MTRTEHCPQCGGFIGDAGCNSPRHKYSASLTALLKAKPRDITVEEFDKALDEKFYVNTAKAGVRVGFGKRLLTHLAHHSAADQKRRKKKLLYAVATVKSGKRKRNPQGGPGSWAYAKRFDWGKVLVLTDKNGMVEDCFNIIPDKDARGVGGPTSAIGIYRSTQRPKANKGKASDPSSCVASHKSSIQKLTPCPATTGAKPGVLEDAPLTGVSRHSSARIARRFDIENDTTSAPVAQGGRQKILGKGENNS